MHAYMCVFGDAHVLNLAPQAWRVPKEAGNAGSDVSGGSSNNRVNQLSGKREDGEQSAGE